MNFNLYHLNYTLPENSHLITEMIKSNRGLDETLIREYVSTKDQEYIIRENFNNIDYQTFIKNKCITVKALQESSGYTHVAKVQADNLVDVIHMTNSINGYWFLRKTKNLEVINFPERDTKTWDLITTENDIYLINTIGYIDVIHQCIFKA